MIYSKCAPITFISPRFMTREKLVGKDEAIVPENMVRNRLKNRAEIMRFFRRLNMNFCLGKCEKNARKMFFEMRKVEMSFGDSSEAICLVEWNI